MKEIIYKGKKVKVPFEDANYDLDGEKDVELTNPFSGQKTTVPGYAAAVYDVTTGANHLAEAYDRKHGMGTAPQWKTVRKGLDWFRRYFAKEYMVLLD